MDLPVANQECKNEKIPTSTLIYLLTYGVKVKVKKNLKKKERNVWLKKNPGKRLWLDKVISEILKPLKMVLCSSHEMVS
jgi:hypothetical protein